MLAQVIRETGFQKAEDFYIALGSGKLGAGRSSTRCSTAEDRARWPRSRLVTLKPPKARSTVAGDSLGIVVPGVDDVLVRLAKCCTPVPGDPIHGYISLGRGITIHRDGLSRTCKALMRNPERFTPVEWEGGTTIVELPRPDRGRRRGTARACSRTSPGRSPSTAPTSSPTAAPSRTGWRATGTPPSSAT